MIPCPSCGGVGHWLLFPQVQGNTSSILCQLCEGTGQVTDEQAGWHATGKVIAEAHRTRGLTTRKAAELVGVTAADYCLMRLGKTDPSRIVKAFWSEGE